MLGIGHAYRGFNANVIKTANWITINRSVDITDYVYGKKSKIIQKSFNFFKWLLRINKLRKLITKLSKLFKFKPVKFVIKKLTTFGIKSLKSVGKFGLKVSKILITKPLKWVNNKFKTFGLWMINKTKLFFKRVIKKCKRWFLKVFKPAVKVIAEYIKQKAKKAVSKFAKSKISRVVVSKAGVAFAAAGRVFTYSKGVVTAVRDGAIELYKKNAPIIIGKVVGFGKDAKDFAIKTKTRFKQTGESAVKFFNKTKQKWRVGWKLFKRSSKQKFNKFILNNKIFKAGAWMFKMFVKLIKGLFTLGKFALKGVVGVLANALAAPTAFLSYLIPLILGSVFEWWDRKSSILSPKISKLRMLYRFGEFILAVLGWCIPGGALIRIAAILLGIVPDLAEYFYDNWNEFTMWKKGQLQESGMDVIFTVSNSHKINDIKSAQQNVFVNNILQSQTMTNMCNNEMISIINNLYSKQATRTQLFVDLNTVFA